MQNKSPAPSTSYTNLSAPPTRIDEATKSFVTIPFVLNLLVLALCWGFLFNALRVDWSTNPQYSYGWFVPVLMLGLFIFRWKSRPEPDQISLGNSRLVLSLLGCALAALLPIRLIEEANPEWRLIQWSHALQVVLITFCALYYAGGWPWIRHFAFTVCFLLVAVPWPVPLEHLFVQNLMRVVAAITVEAVGFLGIPAVQQGNIIQISSGLVGVDEACSGVRSLQTAFFVCLFLGDLYRFAAGRRLFLLIIGFATALLCNVGRTFFLVWSASRHGLDNMQSVHDTAGNLVLIVTLAAIFAVAQLFSRRTGGRPGSAIVAAPGDGSPKNIGEAAAESRSNRPRLLPSSLLVCLLAWVVLAEIGTQAWYRSHEANAIQNARWSVVWPDAQVNAQPIPINSSLEAMLRFNEGKAEAWHDTIGNDWQAFFFRWAPGRNSAQLASAHTPDICLRGIGYELKDDLGIRTIPVQGVNLPFHQYVFTHGIAQLHVFYCRWEDHQTSQPRDRQEEDGSKLSRIRAVLAGRRHLGQQVLEMAINGPTAPEDAYDLLTRQIGQIVHRL
jgi:exosortase